MPSSLTRDRLTEESGAVAIVAGVSLVAMLLMAAFVLDLGALRMDRASSQSVGDMAATAAAGVFAETDDAELACIAGLEYAVANLRGATASASDIATACGGFSGACVDDVAREAVLSAPPYVITLVNPVPDPSAPGPFPAATETLRDRLAQQPSDAAFDGIPCERFGVEVERTRTFLFGGLAGAFDSTTQRGAIAALEPPGDEGLYASLIVLHQSECQSLVASGGPSGGGIVVEGATYDGEYHPGVITVDSAAMPCGPNSEIIDLDGSNSQILADELYSYALQANGDTASNRANVHPNVPASRLTYPEPGPIITRAPVDHVYNCLGSYGTEDWSPAAAASVSSATACEDAGVRPPYLRQLHDRLAGLTSPPAGWTVVTDCTPSADITVGGPNVYVDCAGGYKPKAITTFADVEMLVFKGELSATGASGGVTIQGSATRGATVVVRGNVSFSNQQALNISDAFIYLPTGYVDIGGQATVSWHAPNKTLSSVCDIYDSSYVHAAPSLSPVPPGACFAPLGLWTNSGAVHNLKGGGGVTVVGSFFTPNADEFRLVGGSGQNLDKAQFFAGKLRVDGGGNVRMIANPDTTVSIPLARTLRLIR